MPQNADFARWAREDHVTEAEVARRNLMGRLQDGELTPEEAEAKAHSLGIPRLKSDPDPKRYDPTRARLAVAALFRGHYAPAWPASAWLTWTHRHYPARSVS